MSRSLWQIIVAGWISAALTVTPVLAALQCRVCCDVDAASEIEAEPAPACCANHAQPKIDEPRDTCPTCPKCDAQRPNPVVVSNPCDWKPPTVAIVADWPLRADDRAEWAANLDVGRSFVDRSMPPPRVLYCSWLK